MAASMVFLKPPRPEISLKAEEIFSIGPAKITNSIITSWIVIATLVLIAWRSTRNMREIPSGLQNLVEAGLEAFLGLVESVAGERNGRRFFPLVATILIYVMISNWFGLLPGFGTIGVFHEQAHGAVVSEAAGIHVIGFKPAEVKETDGYVEADGTVVQPHNAEQGAHNDSELVHLKEKEKVGTIFPFLRGVNTDLNATLALALTAVVFIQIWGFRTLGVRGYGGKFINTKRLRQGNMMGIIDLFVGVLEMISEFARLISFTFRLFGNIFAGEVLVLIITFLVPLFAIEIFYVLELFVGFIQAFVFAMLTLVFAVMAVAGHGEHEAEDHQAEALHPPLTGTGPEGVH